MEIITRIYIIFIDRNNFIELSKNGSLYEKEKL